MQAVTLLVLSFAVWRISSLFVDEDGPGDIFAKIRYYVGVRYDQNSEAYGTNIVADAFTCLWCFSVWVSFLAAFFSEPKDVMWFVINWLAISALSIKISTIGNK